jgi:drug/metabolite transporter (DMT)-like permease
MSRRNKLLLIVSGFFLAAHFATWISSLFYTTVARATLFVDLQPVWAAILGTLFLRERLSGVAVAGVAIVTAGGCVTVAGSWEGGGPRIAGDLLAVAGGVAGAAYLVIGRSVRFAIPWARYMLAVYGISAAWLLLLCLVSTGGAFPRPAERDLLWIGFMAIGPGILGHGLINLAIRDLKAYAVNAALLGEPVLATILAYFLFAEKPDAFYYAGAALIFAGLLLVFRRAS